VEAACGDGGDGVVDGGEGAAGVPGVAGGGTEGGVGVPPDDGAGAEGVGVAGGGRGEERGGVEAGGAGGDGEEELAGGGADAAGGGAVRLLGGDAGPGAAGGDDIAERARTRRQKPRRLLRSRPYFRGTVLLLQHCSYCPHCTNLGKKPPGEKRSGGKDKRIFGKGTLFTRGGGRWGIPEGRIGSRPDGEV
jgi:hypothetical protein